MNAGSGIERAIAKQHALTATKSKFCTKQDATIIYSDLRKSKGAKTLDFPTGNTRQQNRFTPQPCVNQGSKTLDPPTLRHQGVETLDFPTLHTQQLTKTLDLPTLHVYLATEKLGFPILGVPAGKTKGSLACARMPTGHLISYRLAASALPKKNSTVPSLCSNQKAKTVDFLTLCRQAANPSFSKPCARQFPKPLDFATLRVRGRKIQ